MNKTFPKKCRHLSVAITTSSLNGLHPVTIYPPVRARSNVTVLTVWDLGRLYLKIADSFAGYNRAVTVNEPGG